MLYPLVPVLPFATFIANQSHLLTGFGELATPPRAQHTGTDDCPLGVTVDLSGPEWRSLALKSVRRALFGRDDIDIFPVQLLKRPISTSALADAVAL